MSLRDECGPCNRSLLLCRTLAELLLTSGDVGRPRSVLLEKFPQLSTHLQRGLEQERWWYEKGGKGPNCAVTKVLSSTESKADCKVRVPAFAALLFLKHVGALKCVGALAVAESCSQHLYRK